MKHSMNPGVADDKIIEKALVHDFMIVTKDIKLALNSLIRGVQVWHYDAEKNTEYKLIAKHLKMMS
jgi:uncharacterized protein YaiI (UPF0178 family)